MEKKIIFANDPVNFSKYINLKSYLSNEIGELFESLQCVDNDVCLAYNGVCFKSRTDCLLDVDFLNGKLLFTAAKTIDFASSVRSLASYLPQISLNMIEHLSGTNLADEKTFCDLIEKAPDQLNLIYLKVFSYLERYLGDIIYTLNNMDASKVPFLLRDIVDQPQLKMFLGESTTNLLKLLVHGPSSLNLRNLAWHGFLNPADHRPDLVYFCVAILVTIRHTCHVKCLNVMHRRKFNLNKIRIANSNRKLAANFRALHREQCLSLINESKLVDDCRRSIWTTYFLNTTWSNFDLICLILPELEHLLRKLYAMANELESNSCQIALMTEFYYTMDDLVSFYTKDDDEKIENKLIRQIDPFVLVTILDMFNYMDGPRLRDRISHGELDESIDVFYVEMLAYLMIKLLGSDISMSNYEVMYHPICVLKNDLFELWQLEIVYDTSRLELNNQLLELHATVRENFHNFQLDDDPFKLAFRYQLPNSITKSHELQLIQLIRTQIKLLLNLNDYLDKKFRHFSEEQAPERRRKCVNRANFYSFYEFFAFFFDLTRHLFVRIFKTYLFVVDNRHVADLKRIKFLKHYLKLLQNLSSACEKNKWLESHRLILNNDYIKLSTIYSHFL